MNFIISYVICKSDINMDTHNTCTRDKCHYNLDNDLVTKTSSTSQQKQRCTANFCVSCGVNMGDSNPRQYCKKTYCPHEK